MTGYTDVQTCALFSKLLDNATDLYKSARLKNLRRESNTIKIRVNCNKAL